MKTQGRTGRRTAKINTRDRHQDDKDLVCFKCGLKGHRAKECRQKTWCSRCKSETHKDATCRRKDKDNKEKQDGACRATEDRADDYAFKMTDGETGTRQVTVGSIQERGLMVDTGATSHIITDESKFKDFDTTFRTERHSVELADGTRCNGVAQRRGNAEFFLFDSRGQRHKVTLRDALFIPSYPQDIFSVKAATASGAKVVFEEGKDALITRDGNQFDIHVYGKLYYLHTEGESNDKCNACHDIQTWHEILGHCNYDDVIKLQNVVAGMRISAKHANLYKNARCVSRGSLPKPETENLMQGQRPLYS